MCIGYTVFNVNTSVFKIETGINYECWCPWLWYSLKKLTKTP